MENTDRLELIMRELKKKKVTDISELTKVCFVSPCTLRRDLIKLEKRGLIQRTYGKVILQEHPSQVSPYDIRIQESTEEKAKIARLAADLVQDSTLLMLDSSSTVERLIPFLKGKHMLHIVTNGLKVAMDCEVELPDANIYCTGGELQRNINGFTGTPAIEMLETFRPDMLFFSANALSMEDGVMVVNEQTLHVKRSMMRFSKKCVLMCDSRKFTRRGYRVLCPFRDIDCLITDRRPSDDWIKVLRDAGVEVLYPEN